MKNILFRVFLVVYPLLAAGQSQKWPAKCEPFIQTEWVTHTLKIDRCDFGTVYVQTQGKSGVKIRVKNTTDARPFLFLQCDGSSRFGNCLEPDYISFSKPKTTQTVTNVLSGSQNFDYTFEQNQGDFILSVHNLQNDFLYVEIAYSFKYCP